MENTLNLVFDKWDEENNEPIHNSSDIIDTEGSNNIDRTMRLFGYKNYKKCKIEDIDKYPDKKFYYVLNDVWLVKPVLENNKLPINNNIIKLLKEKENLYYLNLNEGEVENIETLYKIDKLTKLYNIKSEKIFIVDNNPMINNFKEHLKLDINVHFSKIMSLSIKNVNRKYNIDVNFVPIKNDKASLFLCQNNKPKAHRLSLLILLKKYNILDDVDWSLINGTGSNCEDETETFLVNILLKNDIELFKKEIEYFYCGMVKYNNNNNEKDLAYNSDNTLKWQNSTVEKTYENSYFNIATETLFTERSVHITEKSFKPFAYYHYPLFLATHHHVKCLRDNFDLDLFDDIIDHSYDNIIDNTDRLFKFMEEIKRIHDNKDFFIKFYEENQERFIENYKKYNNLNNSNDISFFDSLI